MLFKKEIIPSNVALFGGKCPSIAEDLLLSGVSFVIKLTMAHNGSLCDYPLAGIGQAKAGLLSNVTQLVLISKKNSMFKDIVHIGGREVNPISTN